MSEEKERAQREYELHVAEMRKLYIPEPLLGWEDLSPGVKELWRRAYPL